MMSLVDLFCDMVRVDSESGDEAAFVQHAKELLEREFHAVCELDAYGNLIAHIDGLESSAAPVALSAHADTVKPGVGIEPVVEDGVVRSAGETILAADDKAGLAEIIEAIRTAERHPPIDVILTLGEEVGLLGARNLDLGKVRAKMAFVIDGEHLHDVVIGGPTHILLDITVVGRASHAGMEPEKGISAIRVASAAIAQMPEGRIDVETTANVGIIEGGLVRNGVPERCAVTAECRSLDHDKAIAQAAKMREAFESAAAEAGARVEIDETIAYRASSIAGDAPVVKTALDAVRSVGIDPVAKTITGGTDALILCNRGIDAVVLGTGVRDAHATSEHVTVADLETASSILRNLLESLA
ncbi:MAG: M20/M25/M40 family metallo-hydrolase [Candidatus Bipolaricaulia bacterium]